MKCEVVCYQLLRSYNWEFILIRLKRITISLEDDNSGACFSCLCNSFWKSSSVWNSSSGISSLEVVSIRGFLLEGGSTSCRVEENISPHCRHTYYRPDTPTTFLIYPLPYYFHAIYSLSKIVLLSALSMGILHVIIPILLTGELIYLACI